MNNYSGKSASMISMIAATDLNGLIGYNNTIPWYRPVDLKRFKALTTNSVLIMGAKTFLSIPGKLPNRTIYVVSRNAEPLDINLSKGETYFPDLESAIKTAKTTGKPIWIGGGGKIYKEAMEYVDFIDLTVVQISIPVDDPSKAIYFPIIESVFELKSEAFNQDDVSLKHLHYERSL